MLLNKELKDNINININNQDKFDFNSAINLFPNLLNLINLSSIQLTIINNNNNTINVTNSIQEDIEIRNSKLEIGRNVNLNYYYLLLLK